MAVTEVDSEEGHSHGEIEDAAVNEREKSKMGAGLGMLMRTSPGG